MPSFWGNPSAYLKKGHATAVVGQTTTLLIYGKIGHITPVCKSAAKMHESNRKLTNTLYSKDSPPQIEDDEESPIFMVGRNSSKAAPMKCELKVESRNLTMEIDTGAEVSIIAEDTFKALLRDLTLSPSSVVLRTYTHESIAVRGEAQVTVQHGVTTQQLRLVVVAGGRYY